jgi:putative inorganic carbon (hco3(-)) transporter
MSHLFLLGTLLTLYIRPGDLNPAWQGIPFLYILSGGLGLTLILSWAVRASRPVWTPHLTWILGTWFGFVLSHAAVGFYAMTITTLTGFFTNVFIVFAMVFVLTTPGRLKNFSTVWIFCALFLAMDGIVQSATGVGFGGQPLVKGRIQGVGTFADPNDLALAFLIAVPLAHARFYANSRLGKPFFLLLAGIFTYSTFLTNSRGGILSLLLVFFLISAHRFGPKLGTFIGGVLILALLALGPSRMNEVSSGESSAQGRIAAWSEGLQMFKYHPVVGVGAGRFTDYHELTAHNSFVLCFAETGFVGAFFWIGLLYVSIWALRRSAAVARSDPEERVLAAYAKDTQIAFFGFFSGIFFLSRTYNMLLYLLVGFAGAVYAQTVRAKPESRIVIGAGERWKIAGIVAGGIVLIYVLVKTLAIWSGNFY